jgi:hypothetical protein
MLDRNLVLVFLLSVVVAVQKSREVTDSGESRYCVYDSADKNTPELTSSR